MLFHMRPVFLGISGRLAFLSAMIRRLCVIMTSGRRHLTLLSPTRRAAFVTVAAGNWIVLADGIVDYSA